MVDINFRTNGAWGTGLGTDLAPELIDGNFYALKVAVEEALAEAGAGAGDDIVSISLSGTSLYFYKASGAVLGPVTLPIVGPHWRGEFAGGLSYDQMDIFRVTSVGLYLSLQDHTTVAPFNEGATQGGNALYLKVFGFSGASGVNLADLGDVALAGLSDQQFLRYNSTAGKWENVTLAALSGLDSLADVTLTSPADKNVLRYDSGTSQWINEPLGTMADQGAGSVSITGGTITGLPTPTGGTDAATKAYVDSVGAAGLPGIASADVLANLSGSSASPTGHTVSDLLDYVFDTARGSVLFRGNAGWTFLPPGTAGTFLKTGGASADPSWAAPVGSGTVTEVDTGTGLTGGPIIGAGTVALDSVADSRVLANVSGTSAAPTPTSLTALLDHIIGTARGSLIVRGSGAWAILGPGSIGQFLASGGAGADLTWQAPAGSGTVTEVDTGAGLTGGPIVGTGTVSLASVSDGGVLANISGSTATPTPNTLTAIIDHAIGSTRGDVLYRGASGWAALTPGAIGSFLQTQGSGADPAWASVGAGSGVTTAASLWLEAAAYATAAALPSNSYNNGTSGVGATLTASSNGALTVDGSAVNNGDRILVKNEATASHNGVYAVTQKGDGSHPFILTRVTDYDSTSEIVAGTAIYVLTGTANSKTSWVVTQAASVTVGTTSVTFESLSVGLPVMAAGQVLGNPNSYSAPAVPASLSSVIDQAIGSTRGDILFRNASGWTVLPPGTAGYALVTGGAGADPSWAAAAGTGTVTHTAGALTTHAPIVGAGGSDEKSLAAMTDGQLMIGSTGADPALATLTAGTNVTITNAAGSITIDAAGGTSTLAADTDVNISSAANDDFLEYQTSDSKWHNRTPTQATAALSAVVGDSGSGGTKGLVPAPGAGDAAALKYLKADGTWATTPGASVATNTDVSLSGVANHDVVWYLTSDNKWHNTTISAAIDAVFGSARGDVLYRGVSGWSVLGPGTAGNVLQTGGAGADPSWTAPSGGSSTLAGDTDVNIVSPANKDVLKYQTSDGKWHNVTLSALLDDVLSSTQGSVLYRGSSAWSALAPGNAGQNLITLGSGANPKWSNPIAGVDAYGNTIILGTAVDCATANAAAGSIGFSYAYSNGTAGVGATITASANGAQTIDGVALNATGLRVLIKNESVAANNGVYQVTTVGDASHALVLTRVTDFDQAAEMLAGTAFFVKGGTVNAGSFWDLTATVSTVGTTSANFAQVTGTVAPASGGGGAAGGGLFSNFLSAITTQAGAGMASSSFQTGGSVANSGAGVSVTQTDSLSNDKLSFIYGAVSGTYTKKALLQLTAPNWQATICAVFVGWYDGTKLQVARILCPGNNTPPQLYLTNYTDHNTWSSNPAGPIPYVLGMMTWISLADDGTNFTVAYSNDGANFINLITGTKSGGFLGGSGYSNICFGVAANGAKAIGTLVSWA